MTEDTAKMVARAYRVRMYPTKAQAGTLRRLLGAKRFVWNWALQRKRDAFAVDGTRLNGLALSREFTVLRQQPTTSWLGSLPREPFAQLIRDLDRAWSNFFAGRAKRPRRKKRGAVDRVRFTLDQRRAQVDRDAGRVQLDVVGKVRFVVSEPLVGRLRSVTVQMDSARRWFATFTADGVAAPQPTVAPIAVVGVDLGLRDAAVLSTGEQIAAPKALGKKLARLRRYQRRAARQRDAAARRAGFDPAKPIPKGTRFARPGDRRPPPANGHAVVQLSERSERTRRQIGRLHAQVADQRRDFLHQLSRRIVDQAQVICIENLAVSGMVRSMGRKRFRRSVADASLGELRRQLTYKADWAGRTVSVVDRWFPSSKTCSACAAINAELQLHERQWTCACGAVHDRDINAAINIAREGMRQLVDAPSTPRSGGIDARGEASRAAGNSSPAGQPTSKKREPIYRRECGSPSRRGMEPHREGVG